MKKLLWGLIFLPVFAFGQTIRGTDSTGTATVYWQTVNLFTSTSRLVQVLNDGNVNLRVTYWDKDTVASRTRYQVTVKPGETLTVQPLYSNQYIYIKAASTTCSYRVHSDQ